MLEPTRTATGASLAVASSLLISLLLVAMFPQGRATDEEARYAPVARSLLAGQGIVHRSGPLWVWYPPGYPIMLAGLYWVSDKTGVPETTVLAAAGVAGMCASTLFVFLMSSRLWDVRGGLASALTWATYPLALYFLIQPTSEIPFMVAVLAALWCVSRVAHGEDIGLRRAALCGALIGVAMLIRPIAIGLGVVLACLIIASGQRRSVAVAVVLVTANLAIVAPWEMLVYARTDRIVPLGANGPASVLDGLTFTATSRGYRDGGAWVPSGARGVMQRIEDQVIAPLTLSAVGRVLARETATYPLGVAELIATKAVRSWYGTDSQRFESLIIALQAIYLALVGFATRRAWQAGGNPWRLAIGCWTIATYFWAMSIVGLSIARYMVPAMSVLFLILPAIARSASPRDRSAAQDRPV